VVASAQTGSRAAGSGAEGRFQRISAGSAHTRTQVTPALKYRPQVPINPNMNGAAYKFRLERVRALRERHEDQAKQDFAIALQVRQNSRDHEARALDRIIEARRAQLGVAGQARFSADDLMAHQLYLERMEQGHRAAVEQVARHEQKLEQRRVALTKASQDREALERLKEKGLEDHNREAARIEQNVLDEIAGNGHWRRAA